MKGIIRVIVWSILSIIFLILGTFGLSSYIMSTSISSSEKKNIENIINAYNSSEKINELKSMNTISAAHLKRNKLIISYSDEIVDTKYEYIYKNNNLSITIDNNDENAWLVTKLLVDAVSVSKGKEESKTYLVFENIKVDKISNDDAFSIAIGETSTDINIRTDISLKIINPNELINSNLLEQNIDKIKAFDYNYNEEDIILNMYKESNYSAIKLSQVAFTDKSYNLIIKLLSYILSNEDLVEFKENYPSIVTDKQINILNYKITYEEVSDIKILKIYIYEKSSGNASMNDIDEYLNNQE